MIPYGCLHQPAGTRIGLFGGSFDPAHDGHLHVAMTAIKRLRLHHVWWLPAHAHPFKPGATPFRDRLASARAMATGPAMRVHDLEAAFELSSSADLIAILKQRLPNTHLIWLVGEDILAHFHLWRRWPAIVRSLPIAVIARPGCGAKIRFSKFPLRYAAARRPEHDAARLPLLPPPAWTRLSAPFDNSSSHKLRSQDMRR